MGLCIMANVKMEEDMERANLNLTIEKEFMMVIFTKVKDMVLELRLRITLQYHRHRTNNRMQDYLRKIIFKIRWDQSKRKMKINKNQK